jgi:hypothetical protein
MAAGPEATCAGVAGAVRSGGWAGGPVALRENTSGVKRVGPPESALRRGNRAARPSVRGRMSIRQTIPAALLLVAISAAACSSGGAPTPSPASSAPGSPVTPTAVPSPSIEGIAHPTGADGIILRFDEAGGFVPPEWNAAHLPYFTLYGDGRVVFVQATAQQPVRQDNVSVGLPVRTATLSEEQIQGLLTHALTDGGLAIARTDYQNPMVADAPTAVFTVNADNDTKTVSVVALGMEGQPGPDTAVLKRLTALGDRLRDFDQGGSLGSAPYEAAAYRGVILEQQGIAGVQVREWPWTDIAPSDFKLPADVNALQQGTRTMTPEEVAAVGVEPYQNGISSGVFLRAGDGKIYSLVIRPLLPDEKA